MAELPPNLVFVMADDLGWAELSCYGQKRFETPRLDRMAREGMRFTQWYSASPVCAPARCSLMTGLHTGHCWIRDNREIQPEGQEPLPEGARTIARWLDRAGYSTGMAGKWGLGGPGSSGAPGRQGFGFFYGYLCQRQAHNFYPTHLWRNDERVELEGNVAGNVVGRIYSHDLITEAALGFVRTNREKPFFLYLPFTIPHVALQVPDDSLALYRGRLPDAPYEGEQGYLPHAHPHAAYAAMVARLDRDVGRLLDLLAELGLDERTLVIFTSDNGPTHGRVGGADSDFFESSGPFRGRKGSLHEGGIRVPFIARWPGAVPAGVECHSPFVHYDVFPTLLDVAGLPRPTGLDGLSAAPALRGETDHPRHSLLYFEFPGYGGWQAVRLGRLKALRRDLKARLENRDRIELYDLESDPGETTDLASARPDLIAASRALFRSEHSPSDLFPFPEIEPGS